MSTHCKPYLMVEIYALLLRLVVGRVLAVLVCQFGKERRQQPISIDYIMENLDQY